MDVYTFVARKSFAATSRFNLTIRFSMSVILHMLVNLCFGFGVVFFFICFLIRITEASRTEIFAWSKNCVDWFIGMRMMLPLLSMYTCESTWGWRHMIGILILLSMLNLSFSYVPCFCQSFHKTSESYYQQRTEQHRPTIVVLIKFFHISV